MGFDPKAFVSGQSQPSGGFDPIAFLSNKPQSNDQAELKQDYPLRRKISKYAVHPIIEGGAMTLGGLAAAPLAPETLGLAPVAAAAAMYPPAHEAANAVDRMMGIGGREKPMSNLERTLGELETGAEIEAGGKALGAVGSGISEIPFAKFGSAFTGTPASNLSRAYKKGLSTYIAKPLEEASDNYGAQESRVMMDHLTAEEQAAMVTDQSGFARNKLNDVLVRWLKGGDISVKDAVQAKQALNALFPTDTAKKAVLRGKMSQFGDELNSIIAEKDPAMRGAIQDYADSSLRSQLLQPLRVNKLKPTEPSKLGIMLATEGVAQSDNPFQTALKALTAQSPAFHGFVASLSGQIAKLLPKLGPEQQQALARGLFSSYQASQNQQKAKQ